MYKRGGRLLPSTWRALLVLPVWLGVNLWLWSWWLQSDRIVTPWLFIPLTIAMLYEFAVLPTFLMYFTMRAKLPKKRRLYSGQRVAVITPCVPAQESLDIIEAQLKAMSEITYPHDSWILDEGNSPAVRKLARKYGVYHFTRRGKPTYNQDTPPFKAKTKAGNVNAWLKHVKRRKYDYFVQLDIDHHPQPNYLDVTLGHFRDKKVAWVQAPSVYGNFEHWTALGATEQELVLQGPLQMGFYGTTKTPFIIGSHTTYRTSAIEEIGGYQPTRAEDHLDTVTLASAGYEGVFVPEIIAVGDGPENLETYLAQQFAWAYSMFQVFMDHSPTLLKTMSWRRKIMFMFAQTWYPIWSLSYSIMFFTPVIALVTNRYVAQMGAYDFITRFLPVLLGSLLVWWAARPLMMPKRVRFSWRGALLHIVRWPIVLLAVLNAAFRVKKPYMITPKGKGGSTVPPDSLYRLFLFLGYVNVCAIIFALGVFGNFSLVGQVGFALFNVFLMLLVCGVDVIQRRRKATVRMANVRRYWLKPISAITSLALIAILAVPLSLPMQDMIYARAIRKQAENTERKPQISFADPTELSDSELISNLVYTNDTYDIVATPVIGAYDPAKTMAPLPPNSIRHSFVDWGDDRRLAEELLVSKRSHNVPLVTLEPRLAKIVGGQDLLTGIDQGLYDTQLNASLDMIGLYDKPVYVRFAHEMDLGQLYPWGGQDPQLYIAAYRHVVELAHNRGIDNIRWVWSPAGNANAVHYYPGDDVVDVIGTTILHDQFWYGNRQPTFSEMSSRRVWLQEYGKPVWITELGVGAADSAMQSRIISDATKNYQRYGYQALIYLNIEDTNLTHPDYRLANPSDYWQKVNELTPDAQPARQSNQVEARFVAPREAVLAFPATR